MKLIRCSWVFIFGVFLVGVLKGSDRELTIPRTEDAPKIDGKLDDQVWRRGAWFTGFSLISDPTELAEVQTEFQIAHDDENLYLAIRMREPEPGSLRIEEFRKDGVVCYDDSIELMIDPYGSRYEYYHFITNAVGIKYDARRSYGGEFHDLEANPDWKVATTIGSNEWTVEIAIPFVELNLNKKSAGPWAFNVARHRWAGNEKAELSSFSPMRGSFHVAQKFSKLIIPDLQIEKFLWGIKRPYDYQIEADKGDWILTGKVQIKNDGSPNEKFRLLFKQVSKKRSMLLDVLTGEIEVGEEKEYTFRLPIEREDPLELQIEIVNPENAKEAYRVKRVFLDLDYRPMMLQLISPSYRNSIYATESIAELKMLIRVTLPSKVLNGSRLQVRLLGEKVMGVSFEKEFTGVSNMEEVCLPIGDLPPERYVIEAQIVDRKGDIIARTSQILKKLKPEEHEWRVDEYGALLHNGVPFLPKGWLGMLPDEMQPISGSLYNTLFVPKDVTMTEEEAKKFLDSVLKAKGYAVMYPYPSKELLNSGHDLLKPLTNNEIRMIQQRVKFLKKHPALMAWLIAYEPEFDSVLQSRIKQVYSIIMEEDPFHPAIIVNSSIKGIGQYLGMADIMMAITANTFVKGGNTIRPLNAVSYYLDMANKMAKEGTTFWTGLQAHDYSNNWNELVRIPTFLELRNMLYQAIIEGVKGCFWDDYSYTYNYPEVKVGVEHLVKELTLLENAVLAKEIAGNITLESEKENIIFSQRVVESDKYLFVVNTGVTERKVAFNAPLFDGVDKLYVLSEGRTVDVDKGGIFTDYFGPYATHVYLTKPFKEGLASLREVEDLVDATNKGKKKVGNLAFEDSGVKITASSLEDLNLITKLNDGIFDGIAWTSKKGEELPQWIELNWVKPIKLEKIVIYSDTIENAKVQVERNGTWLDIADFKRRSGGHLKAIFKEIETNKTRVLITEKKPGVTGVTLSEIEVYNSTTKEKD